MVNKVSVRTGSAMGLVDFLEDNDFIVETVGEVLKVSRSSELDVFLSVDEHSIYFEVELGNISNFSNDEVYFKLLDLNTEITPVSIGIDSTDQDNPVAVLVERRETQNLDSNELLSVFDAIEIAQYKVEQLLAQYIK